jgi:hypothetical protein
MAATLAVPRTASIRGCLAGFGVFVSEMLKVFPTVRAVAPAPGEIDVITEPGLLGGRGSHSNHPATEILPGFAGYGGSLVVLTNVK